MLLRITEQQILALLERILLGEFLAIFASWRLIQDKLFHREGAKDAKKRQGDFLVAAMPRRVDLVMDLQ